MAADKKTFIRNAQKQVQKGQLDRAITTYKAILKLDPNDVKVHNTLGDLLIRKRQKKEGVTEYLWVAEYYEKDGFLLRSIAICQKILNLDQDMVQVRLKLADLYTQQRLAAEAKKQLLLVADYYEKKGKVAEALEAFGKLADLDPGNLQIRIRLGSSYEKQGMPGKAAREYARAAEGLIKAGSADKAGELLDKALGIAPSGVEARRVKAELHAAAEEWDKAAETLAPLAEAEGADVQILKTYAGACLKTGAPAEAIVSLEKALEAEPASFPLKTLLGRAYIEGKDFEKARELYKPLIEEYLKEDKLEVAEDLARQLTAADPANEQGLRQLLAVLEKSNDEAEQANTHARLAALLETRGDTESALASLAAVLKIRPDDEAAAAISARLRGGEPEAVPEAPTAAGPEGPAEDELEIDVEGFEEAELAGEEGVPVAEDISLQDVEEVVLEGDEDLVVDEEEVEITLEEEGEEIEIDLGLEEPAAAATPVEAAEAPAPEEPPAEETTAPDLPGDGADDRAPAEPDFAPGADESSPEDEPPGMDVVFTEDEEVLDLPGEGLAEDGPSVDLSAVVEAELGDLGAAESPEEADETVAPETELSFDDLADEAGAAADEGLDGADLFSSDEVSELVQEGILDGGQEPETSPEPEGALLQDVDLATDEIDLEAVAGDSGEEAAVLDGDLEGGSLGDLDEMPLDEAGESGGEADSGEEALAGTEPSDGTGLAEEPAAGDGMALDVESLGELDAAGEAPAAAAAVAAVDPENEELEEFLAEADFYMQQGLTDEAEFLYQKLVKLAPDNGEIAERLERLHSGKTGAEEQPPEDEPLIAKEEIEALESDLDRVLGVEKAPAPAPAASPDEGARKLTVADGEGSGDMSEFSDFLTDLKGELEEEAVPEPAPVAADEQSLSEIFQEFQEGLREQLGEEDFETHYNLGIAYKEMGLMQEALGEFRLSEKSQTRQMDSISMIALCHREMGSIDEAVGKLEEGLTLAVEGSDEQKGLSYDLGDILFQEGREEEAREIFRRLYESFPDYRDVSERAQMSRRESPPAAEEKEELEGGAPDSGQSRVSYL